MISHSRYIFDTLSSGLSIPSLASAKLSPPSEEEAAALVEQFLRFRIAPAEYLINNVRLHEVTHETTRYVAFCNLSISETSTKLLEADGIVWTEPNQALLLASLKDMEVKRLPSVNLQELEENILAQQEDTEKYDGHNIDELKDYFEPIAFFSITSNSIYSARSTLETAYHIASFSHELINPKIIPFLASYRNLFSHEGSFMKQNIFWSMTSTHYKHAFLELYRCVESIYTLPRALGLKAKTGLDIPGHIVAKICIEELGWRRKEEDSLLRVLRLVPTSHFQTLELQRLSQSNGHEWEFSDPQTEARGFESLAKFIYKIRNQMVHQFEADQEISVSSSDWPLLMELLITIIDYVFVQYAQELPQPSTATSNTDGNPNNTTNIVQAEIVDTDTSQNSTLA